MKRPLCAVGLCVVLAHAAVAVEPPQKSEPSSATAVHVSSEPGRKQLEALLQTPANLHIGKRKQLSVGAVFDQLHEQHHLSIRFDTPTLPEFQESLPELLEIEVDVQHLDLSRASIATVLRHALDAAPTERAEDFGDFPIPVTNAMLLDYLVEEDGLLITTRMNALTTKETRVYSVKHLPDQPPELLAKTICQSVRPWSWRSHINDLGDQLKGTPLPPEVLAVDLKTGVQLAGAEVGISVTPVAVAEGTSEPKKSSSADEARQMEMLGSAIVNGLVTMAQATLSALEIVHYAEPPTGTIQTLGNKLIITQSQAAHREIAELLKQLSEE